MHTQHGHPTWTPVSTVPKWALASTTYHHSPDAGRTEHRGPSIGIPTEHGHTMLTTRQLDSEAVRVVCELGQHDVFDLPLADAIRFARAVLTLSDLVESEGGQGK